MSKRLLMLLILSVFVCAAMGATAAVKKPAAKAKPVAKKPTAPTVALAGDKGEFGTVYSLSKQSPIYFRLKSAEFTTDQVVIGDNIYVPTADQKMLVLHFTVQNPQKNELYVRWDSLRFTAVDKTNNNCEGNNHWGDEDDPKRGSVGLSLKPTQKVNCVTPIFVPANGIVPKLMVLPGDDNDGPILRYDLSGNPKNKVAPLPVPIADPDDKTGYTALETVPGVVGTSYPYGNLDITVEKFEYTTSALGERTPEEEGRFLLVTVLMKNEMPAEYFVRWDVLSPTLTSTDGEELSYVDMLMASSNRPFAQEMKPRAEVRVRLVFNVPQDVTPKTLLLKEEDSRGYEFEVK